MTTTYAEYTTITMPGGVYRVWMATTKRAMEIERQNPNTGNWRKVWTIFMRKDIGKRLMTVVTLAGAHV